MGQDKSFSAEEAAVISESVKQSTNVFEVKFKNTNWLMGAIVIVLFIGFLTMLFMVVGLVLDTWRFKSNSYEGLIETMRTQEKIINNNKVQQAEFRSLLENIQKELQKKEIQ